MKHPRLIIGRGLLQLDKWITITPETKSVYTAGIQGRTYNCCSFRASSDFGPWATIGNWKKICSPPYVRS